MEEDTGVFEMSFVIQVCEFEGLCVGEFYEYGFLRNDKQSALFYPYTLSFRRNLNFVCNS